MSQASQNGLCIRRVHSVRNSASKHETAVVYRFVSAERYALVAVQPYHYQLK